MEVEKEAKITEVNRGSQRHAGFEVFDRSLYIGGVRLRNRPEVSLTSAGQFSISGPAVEMLGEDVQGVVLLYDRDTRRVGFLASNIQNPRAHLLRDPRGKRGGGRSRLVSARLFCKAFGIPLGSAVSRYAAKIEEGMLVIDLKEPLGDSEVGE